MLLPWKPLKPIKKTDSAMDTEKLISLKQNFTGQKFQWVKTDRPELLAKVVKCRDVDAHPNGKFFIVFDDGSKVDSTKLNSDLLMIHGDMPPLTKEEVLSIYGNKNKPSSPLLKSEEPHSPQLRSPEQHTPPVTKSPQANVFSMFNSEETNMSLNIRVRIPEKKLLKMMYANAENKDAFISELADHLHSMINKQVVKNSIQSILDPSPTRIEKGPINLTEVHGSNK